MAPEFSSEECRWLTVGIGGLTGVEEVISKKYPNCKIYGIDPVNPGNFSEIGKLLKVGVGLKDSILPATKEDEGIKIISLPRLLDEFVHSRLIHYLSIDIESYEMIILPEILINGKFGNENITFCQIDIELHDPKKGIPLPEATNLNRAKWVLDFIAESSPYLPIFTVSYTPAHKVTFVNIENHECEKAFKIKSTIRTSIS
uniref:Methyltransferase FkbM domain-containing protein n=1 Tax=Panagrolaimus sp. PS1159 TaxID=55785 RepID=A0AC35FYS5_9BILA